VDSLALNNEQSWVLLAWLQSLLSHILLLTIRLIVIIILVSINIPTAAAAAAAQEPGMGRLPTSSIHQPLTTSQVVLVPATSVNQCRFGRRQSQ
jgi:hypothetical protein